MKKNFNSSYYQMMRVLGCFGTVSRLIKEVMKTYTLILGEEKQVEMKKSI